MLAAPLSESFLPGNTGGGKALFDSKTDVIDGLDE